MDIIDNIPMHVRQVCSQVKTTQASNDTNQAVVLKCGGKMLQCEAIQSCGVSQPDGFVRAVQVFGYRREEQAQPQDSYIWHRNQRRIGGIRTTKRVGRFETESLASSRGNEFD